MVGDEEEGVGDEGPLRQRLVVKSAQPSLGSWEADLCLSRLDQ